LRLSESRYVVFADIDVIHSDKTYSQCVRFLRENPYFNFCTIPVAYLTEQFSSMLLDQSISTAEAIEIVRKSLILSFRSPTGSISSQFLSSFAPASSMLLVRRNLLFNVGLFSE